MEYPIITKRLCKSNKKILSIQKESKRVYKISRRNLLLSKKELLAKAKIFKVVALNESDKIIDLTDESKKLKFMKNEDSIQEQIQDNKSMNEQELLVKLDELHIRGLSGGGFKTSDKIRTFIQSGAKTKILIINAVECDPGLVHDEWLLNNQLQTIMKGINILTQSLKFNKVFIVSKQLSDKRREDSLNILQNKAQIITVPYYYPMGEEHQIIQYVTGNKLRKQVIPAQNGILVLNVQTVYALAQAISRDRLQQSRYLTVANLVEGRAIIVKANYGMKVSEVIKEALGNLKNLTIYCGGGVMSAHVVTPDDRIDERMNFIGYQQDVKYINSNRCKGCGACEKNCPAKIPVRRIIKAIEQNKQLDVEPMLMESCLKCGACTFHCPAGKNTMEMIAQEVKKG